jgi:hypothetical protein
MLKNNATKTSVRLVARAPGLPGCWTPLTASECDLPIQRTQGLGKTEAGPPTVGEGDILLLVRNNSYLLLLAGYPKNLPQPKFQLLGEGWEECSQRLKSIFKMKTDKR